MSDRVGAAPRSGWPAFIRLAVTAALVATAAGAALTIAADPLWVFRDRPPWLAWTGGVNRLLDVEMRRSKPLQLARRPVETVLVGSSVVYRGIRPEDVTVSPAYNLGLSSLMAAELPAIAGLLASLPEVRRVLIGLDEFAFTTFAGPPPLDPDIATASGRIRARLGAALSLRSLAGVLPPVLAGAYEPGAWQADGFKTTPDYPASITARLAAEEAGRTIVYRPESVRFLTAALASLKGKEVRLYLSPLSPQAAALLAASGREDATALWRRDVAAVAAASGVPFLDLSRLHPFDDGPEDGSSGSWLDIRHFKPAVGRWILERTGLRGPAVPSAPHRIPRARPRLPFHVSGPRRTRRFPPRSRVIGCSAYKP